MLEPELKKAILHFVRTFHVATLPQLKRFFAADYGKGIYAHDIEQLQAHKLLHDHGGEVVSISRTLPMAKNAYTGILRCLDMMTGLMKSSEIVWFDVANYPLDIRFLTADDEIYDVAYLDGRNWSNKCCLLENAWKQHSLPGEDSPFNHIAVVPNLDVAQKLREFAFNKFVVVDSAGGILGIYDND